MNFEWEGLELILTDRHFPKDRSRAFKAPSILHKNNKFCYTCTRKHNEFETRMNSLPFWWPLSSSAPSPCVKVPDFRLKMLQSCPQFSHCSETCTDTVPPFLTHTDGCYTTTFTSQYPSSES